MVEGDQYFGVFEEIVHLFQCSTFGFRVEEVKCESVGEAANGEDEVVLPSNVGECDRGHLTDHKVGDPRCHG